MDQNKTEGNQPPQEDDSLETPSTAPDQGQDTTVDQPAGDTKTSDGATIATTEKIEEKKRTKKGLEKLRGLNIYLLGFVLVVVVAGMVAYISYSRNQSEEKKSEQLITEPLSQDVLDQLRQTDVRVGDPKQILSVESNAIFSGKVLIRDSLEVAGQLKIGGPLELPGISVSGASTFDTIQGKTLNISGNSDIQGQLNVGASLAVGGNLSVSGSLTAGQLTIDTLQVSGDLRVARHIDAGGSTPSLSRGNAVGGGGTASVSGTDIAGTVNVNTGGSPGSGCFATVTFSRAYNSTPHVVITPIGGAAAGINYYVNRSSSGFSICNTGGTPAGQSFAFDYVVID